MRQFIAYLQEHGDQRISTSLAVAWATAPAGSTIWHYQRLMAVRMFASYLHQVDPTVEVPPAGLLPLGGSRRTPYLYCEQEILALMGATVHLRTAHWRVNHRTLIGLLASTGVRIGEAIGLDREQFDPILGVIVVCGKFEKTRELPLTPSVTRELAEYLRRRDRPVAFSTEHAFFVSSAGTRLAIDGVENSSGSSAAAPDHAPGNEPTDDPQSAPHVRRQHAARCLPHHREPGRGLPCSRAISGTSTPRSTYWYLQAAPELLALAADRLERATAGDSAMTLLAPTLQAFFTDRLIGSGTPARTRSPPTATRSGCCSRFAHQQTGKPPCQLDIDDLDAPLIGAFLDHLEHERGNSTRTRNARLAAIRSLFRYAALDHPEHAAAIERVLAIPPKRHDRTLVTFLTEPETRRAARRTRPRHLDRPPRSRADPARRPDRAARLRADRADVLRHRTSAPARTSAAWERAASNASPR